ncbi:PIN domain-containing protein [soil metagenome]
MSFTTVISSITFDTNILIYSIDTRDPRKHAAAKNIVKSCSAEGAILPLQCLNEFYRATTRKRLLPAADAKIVVQIMLKAMDVVTPSEADLIEAMNANQEHAIPFFDGLLWATAQRAGCTVLLTEDFQDGRILGNVTFRDPFTADFRLHDFLF